MKMKKIMLSILGISALTTSMYAGCSGAACIDVSVDKIVVTSSTIFVATSGDESSLNCTSPANVFTTLSATEASSKAMYSALLTAQTIKKNIKLRIVDGSATCQIAYIEL